MMTYEEALAYIQQLNNRGIALGLERIETLLARLGSPQDTLHCIHVAGTNGKGSVCAFMDSALRKAGLRVGRYSSPAVLEYLECIQINGASISEHDFAAALTQVREACLAMEQDGQELPTVFEVETAVAFLYFAQQQCDYVLLEVGMGGRLDSTNVIAKPVLSVITPVSLDHTAMLGDTLAAIAAEKGGIIKDGCAVVLGPQQQEALDVLLLRCADCGVVPVMTDAAAVQPFSWNITEQCFTYRQWQNISIGLLGDYQCVNAAIALDALQVLQQQEATLTDTAIRSGLQEARWPGRFEVICRNPLFIVDGAHNPAGAKALADTLQQHFFDRKMYLLMGVFKDKDYTEIARIMRPCSDTIYCFQPPQPRGLAADVLAETVQPYYRNVIAADSAAQAVQMVWQEAKRQDAVIVSFGSLSTIREVETAVQHITQQKEGQHGTAECSAK